jgi:succinoglycan biosynthesis protein ExoM
MNISEGKNRPETDRVAITVCICTFRRSSLSDALTSVAEQKIPPNISVRILVIDNDDAPTARDLINGFCTKSGVEVDYRHAPGRNISIARNAALDAVAAPWLAIMDDDEEASPDWLATLAAGRKGANAVFGACEAVYPTTTPSWIRAGDFHSNRIEDRRPIVTGYTSNVLIDMEFVRRHDLRFDITLGRTGGEDTMFFYEMYRKGGVLRYVSNAVVFENVVASRLNLGWVLKRRYRAGQVHAMMFRRFARTAYLWVSWTAPLKLVACIVMFGVTAFNRDRAMWWLRRGTLHFGVLSYAAGLKVHEEYGTRGRNSAGRDYAETQKETSLLGRE